MGTGVVKTFTTSLTAFADIRGPPDGRFALVAESLLSNHQRLSAGRKARIAPNPRYGMDVIYTAVVLSEPSH